MYLSGERLAQALDLLNQNHVFLRRIYYPEGRIQRRRVLSGSWRQLLPPGLERITSRLTDTLRPQTPFRWSHITAHQHLQLDDGVERIMSRHVQDDLPYSTQASYGLPGWFEKHIPSRQQQRSPSRTPMTSRYTAARNFLVRITEHYPGPSDIDTLQKMSSDIDMLQRMSHDSDDESSDDSGYESPDDIDDYEPLIQPPGSCPLCHTIREINVAVGWMRIKVANSRANEHDMASFLETARSGFEYWWEELRNRVGADADDGRTTTADGDEEAVTNHILAHLQLHFTEGATHTETRAPVPLQEMWEYCMPLEWQKRRRDQRRRGPYCNIMETALVDEILDEPFTTPTPSLEGDEYARRLERVLSIHGPHQHFSR
ncbi:Uu.00g069560.m01.CDS01 [Anthostomella pinea]|uniref:Uu.00g069560.m01.CDS01 n=1 Tax=Anthostomella pinea TaxID=933095 RepID=A0AAI8YNP7_9PEZI|nr:Uu.00g069560.m01.CDS01 [Anthostomella pinea]